MKVLRKALARIVSGLLLFCAAQSAVGSLYDGKYGQYATFDVFRTEVNCLTQSATCGVYNFTTPYIAPFDNGVRAVWAAGDYMQFVRGVGSSGPVGDLNYPNVKLIQYSSGGVQKQVVSTDGYVQALGDGILYIGVPANRGGTGYFMSNTEVFPDPDQWTPGNPYEWVVDVYPDDDELDNYAGSNLYLVSATAGAGGSASCSATSVASGGNSTCTATADAGYQFNSWTGACAGQGATCSLTNITSDKASAASFVLLDGDGDGTDDGSDNCPLVSNANQLDTDSDGTGDACDTDDDGDGDNDGSDNCPLVSNANQLDTDSDGTGDACDTDDDGDGTDNGPDNCPLIANPDQLDTDSDGLGDLCDEDDDNDGVLDVSEVRSDCRVKIDCDDDNETDLTDPFPLAVTSIALAPRSSITTLPTSRLSTCSLVLSQAHFSAYTAPEDMDSIGTQAHFSISGCDTASAETVTVEVNFGVALPSDGLVCKVDETSAPLDISNARIRGNSARYTLTDNGPFDTNPTLGAIDNPVTVIVLERNSLSAAPAIPVPINPIWLIFQGLFLGLLAIRALRSPD